MAADTHEKSSPMGIRITGPSSPENGTPALLRRPLRKLALLLTRDARSGSAIRISNAALAAARAAGAIAAVEINGGARYRTHSLCFFCPAIPPPTQGGVFFKNPARTSAG